MILSQRLAKITRIPVGWLPLVLCAAAYTLAMCIYLPLRAETGTDFRDFWETSRHFLDTGRIVSDLGVHNYLPFFTIFMSPFAALPMSVAVIAFTLFSLGLLAVTVVMVEVLLAGRLGDRPRPALIGAILLSFAYVHSTTTLGAVNIILLFLIVAAWFLIERGHDWEAGVPLALAILIKVLPVVLLPLLLVMGRWKSALVASLLAIVLGFGITAGALGTDEAIAQHREFYQRAMVGGSAHSTITAEKPQKAKYSNSAMPIVLRRLLTKTDAHPVENQPGLFVNVAEIPTDTVWIIYCILAVGIFIATLLATTADWGGWSAEAGMPIFAAARAKFGLWCCAMLLASPLIWTHYLVLLYWPLALSADRLQLVWRREERICRVSAFVVGAWITGIAALAWPAARAAGAQLGAVLCVWLGMLILSRTLRPKSRAAAAPG